MKLTIATGAAGLILLMLSACALPLKAPGAGTMASLQVTVNSGGKALTSLAASSHARYMATSSWPAWLGQLTLSSDPDTTTDDVHGDIDNGISYITPGVWELTVVIRDQSTSAVIGTAVVPGLVLNAGSQSVAVDVDLDLPQVGTGDVNLSFVWPDTAGVQDTLSNFVLYHVTDVNPASYTEEEVTTPTPSITWEIPMRRVGYGIDNLPSGPYRLVLTLNNGNPGNYHPPISVTFNVFDDQTVDNNGDSIYLNAETLGAAPLPMPYVSVAAVGSDAVITWGSFPSTAVSVNVYRSDIPGTPLASYATSTGQHQYVDVGYGPSLGTYVYQVSLSNQYGESARTYAVISGSIVSTWFGSPTNAGQIDGYGQYARFTYPDGLSFRPLNPTDDSQNALVAFDSGLSTATFGSPVQVRGLRPMNNRAFHPMQNHSELESNVGSAAPFASASGVGDQVLFLARNGIYIYGFDSGGVWQVAGGVSSHGVDTGDLDGDVFTSMLNHPSDITRYDPQVFYLTDTDNDKIKRLWLGGGVNDVITAVANVSKPVGIAYDGVGALYFTSQDFMVQKLTVPGNVVSTVAGASGVSGTADGDGTSARFNQPAGIAVSGNTLFVADGRTIRQIVLPGPGQPSAQVTTLAGQAFMGGTTDGLSTTARFGNLRSIATRFGTVYVTDTGNHTVRKVETGVFDSIRYDDVRFNSTFLPYTYSSSNIPVLNGYSTGVVRVGSVILFQSGVLRTKMRISGIDTDYDNLGHWRIRFDYVTWTTGGTLLSQGENRTYADGSSSYFHLWSGNVDQGQSSDGMFLGGDDSNRFIEPPPSYNAGVF